MSAGQRYSGTRTAEKHHVRVKRTVAVEEMARTFNHLGERQMEFSDVQMPTGFKIGSEAPRETP